MATNFGLLCNMKSKLLNILFFIQLYNIIFENIKNKTHLPSTNFQKPI